MKKTILSFTLSFIAFIAIAILPVKPAGVKYDETYSFDKSNGFRIDFYAKGNELMKSIEYKTYFQSDGNNFVVKVITEKRGMGSETIIDKKNEVAIQIMGEGGGATPFYNAGGFKYPSKEDTKKLDLVQTDESRNILGYTCRKYTYTYKKIFGEIWLTDEVNSSNDIGVFRAAKMAAIHNTLSVPGFVMEMTTEDAKGGKTVMTTTSLNNKEDYKVELKGVEMNSAINKINYYTF
jgi:GLPGLI family protein